MKALDVTIQGLFYILQIVKRSNTSIEFLKNFIIFHVTLLILVGCTPDEKSIAKSKNTNAIDSLAYWIETSRERKLNYTQSTNELSKIIDKISIIKIDSLKSQYLFLLTDNYPILEDSTGFRRIIKMTIAHNKNAEDSIALAKSYLQLGSFFDTYSVNDSAFYAFSNAQKLFENSSSVNLSGKLF